MLKSIHISKPGSYALLASLLIFGMFATGNGTESQSEAAFDFFEIEERQEI